MIGRFKFNFFKLNHKLEVYRETAINRQPSRPSDREYVVARPVRMHEGILRNVSAVFCFVWRGVQYLARRASNPPSSFHRHLDVIHSSTRVSFLSGPSEGGGDVEKLGVEV